MSSMHTLSVVTEHKVWILLSAAPAPNQCRRRFVYLFRIQSVFYSRLLNTRSSIGGTIIFMPPRRIDFYDIVWWDCRNSTLLWVCLLWVGQYTHYTRTLCIGSKSTTINGRTKNYNNVREMFSHILLLPLHCTAPLTHCLPATAIAACRVTHTLARCTPKILIIIGVNDMQDLCWILCAHESKMRA